MMKGRISLTKLLKEEAKELNLETGYESRFLPKPKVKVFSKKKKQPIQRLMKNKSRRGK
jgi:hypothetical protein